MLRRPPVLPSLVAALALPVSSAAHASPPECSEGAEGGPTQPNIVVVMADDLGYGDLGVYGSPLIRTPRLDQMAAQGLRSTAFYTTPSCSPTRAALMTGAYSTRVEMDSPLGPWADLGLATTEYTLAEMLRDAGYTTAIFGKWHLGDSPDQLPAAQGFDEWLASPWGLPAYPRTLLDSAGPDMAETDPVEWTPLFTDRTLAFIDAANTAGTPFFVMLSHTAPHWPATPSPAFVGTSPDGREYGDAVEEVDHGVGRILDRIDTLGIANDTLVVFLSDNGPALSQGDYQAGDAGGLRGGKASSFEGGVRSPFIARWPGQVPAGFVSDEIVHVVDFFDTFAGLAGATLHPALPTRDGVDVGAILAGGAGDPMRAVHHFQGGTLRAVRQGAWKLFDGALYDLASDPGETTDVAGMNPLIALNLDSIRIAKESEVLAGVRPAGATLRKSPWWRAHQGFTNAPIDGETWEDRTGSVAPWVVVDPNPASDFDLIPITAAGNLPPMALKLAQSAPDVFLQRDGSDLGVSTPGAPFAIELWLRSEYDLPPDESVVLDIGDGQRGMSITTGDLGILGDDLFPGRMDDVVVRIGGATAAAPATLSFDMPSRGDGWSVVFAHVVVSYDVDGNATAWVNGLPADSVHVPGAEPGLDSTWTLFGQDGGLGGNGGGGLLPFDGTTFVGDIAAIRAYDRAMTRKDVETSICRHVSYEYCAPEPGPSGTRIHFDIAGDFRPNTRDLVFKIDGLTGSAWGRLLYSRRQARRLAVGGYLCIDRLVAANSTPIVFGSGSGNPPPVDDGFGSLTEFNFNAPAGTSWNFQLWLRDNGRLQLSNALYVLFCP